MKKLTITMFTLLCASTLIISSCKKKGCTDKNATNYNSKAKKDDGSCTFPIPENKNETTTNKLAGNWSVSSHMYSGFEYIGTAFDTEDFQFTKTSSTSGTVLIITNDGNADTTLTTFSVGSEGTKVNISGSDYSLNFSSATSLSMSNTDAFNGTTVIQMSK